MSPMNGNPLLALALLALPAAAGAVDLDALIAKNTAARGGEAAMASVAAYESDIRVNPPIEAARFSPP